MPTPLSGIEQGAQIYQQRQDRLRNPHIGWEQDYQRIYDHGQIEVGWPEGAMRVFDHLAKHNTIAIVGGAYGDEGKGRITDNKIELLLNLPNIKLVRVIAYHGGNNAGRTLEDATHHIAVHALPAGVLHERTQAIIDQGTVSHIEDLRTEIEYVQAEVGTTSERLSDKVILSSKAILATDLERAEEVLNAKRIEEQNSSSQLAGNTTRKGIATAYGHHYDKTGLKVSDVLADNWEEILGARYDAYKRDFAAWGLDLATIQVSDFKATKATGTSQDRSVGTREEFLSRIGDARKWLIAQDIVRDTLTIHEDSLANIATTGVVFEGVQGVGIDAWIGSRPDVTSSSTIMAGIPFGTAYWQPHDIMDRMAVMKGPYTSSVGARHLPTEISIGKNVKGPEDLPADATPKQMRGAYIRREAHEFGTTSGRPRDIARLDLAQSIYNAHMSGAEVLGVTLMDVVKEDQTIEVATHYTRNGVPVPFHPGMQYQEGIEPHYIQLPGWNGEEARKAKTFDELPENARKYLAFMQARIGMPIVAVTVGPKREHLVTLPGYDHIS